MADADLKVTIHPSIADEVTAAVIAGLNDCAEMLGEVSNRTVPIEEGTLARSQRVHKATLAEPVAAVTYDTPYARRQHEDQTLNHDPGRRAKWLERTFYEQASKVGRHVAAAARKHMPESAPGSGPTRVSFRSGDRSS